MSVFIIQAIGYLASVFLALSLIVTNEIKFRWLNTGGCAAFIVYGILISAFPVLLTNSILLIINLYALYKIYNKTEDFDLLEFNIDATLIAKFLRFYGTDIQNFFPRFQLKDAGNDIRFVVLRDMVIANVFVASQPEEGASEVKFNYTVAKYRDYKVGRFIFEKENSYLLSKGVQRLVYKEVYNKNHLAFLKVMDFQKKIVDGKECWVKELV